MIATTTDSTSSSRLPKYVFNDDLFEEVFLGMEMTKSPLSQATRESLIEQRKSIDARLEVTRKDRLDSYLPFPAEPTSHALSSPTEAVQTDGAAQENVPNLQPRLVCHP